MISAWAAWRLKDRARRLVVGEEDPARHAAAQGGDLAAHQGQVGQVVKAAPPQRQHRDGIGRLGRAAHEER